MPTPGALALVLLAVLSGVMAARLRAAPVPFQPYGKKSSADVVLQLAKINHSSWRAELENILAQPPSGIPPVKLSAYEELIDQNRDDERALALLVPLYWFLTELSGHVEQRQHFLARFVSASDDFMRLVSVEWLLQLHELSLLTLNGNNDFRQDIEFQYEQPLARFQQQEQRSLLGLWSSGLLYFYKKAMPKPLTFRVG